MDSKEPRDIPSLFIALESLYEIILDAADELLPAVTPERAAAMRRLNEAHRASVRALGVPKVTAADEALIAQTERVITSGGDSDRPPMSDQPVTAEGTAGTTAATMTVGDMLVEIVARVAPADDVEALFASERGSGLNGDRHRAGPSPGRTQHGSAKRAVSLVAGFFE